MKRILGILFIGLLLTGLSACGQTATIPEPTGDTIETQMHETEPSEILVEETGGSQLLSYSVYVPNSNVDGFDMITIYTEDISAESVLSELEKWDVLPDAVSTYSFRIDDGLISIDFNQAFGDAVCAMGTSGEYMIVGSVVNTFLDAFGAESLFFTVDGQVLESGHAVYDFAMSQFADPQPIY